MVRRKKRPNPNRQSSQDQIEVILLNPDGTELGSDRRGAGDDVAGHGTAESRPDLGAAVAAGLRQLGRTTATPGPRAGGTSDRVTRQGCDEEVVTPVLVPPALAARMVIERDFFRHPTVGLTVDPKSLERDRFGLRWRARLRTGHLSRRAANLRLYPSPSHNLTVLELIPVARRFLRTGSFVRRGVPAMSELAARLGQLTVEAQASSNPTECSAPR